MLNLSGIPVLVSPVLPFPPSHIEDAGRIVRHGLADVLAWLGEPVGPVPGEPTHAVYGFDGAREGGAVLMVSAERYADLGAEATS